MELSVESDEAIIPTIKTVIERGLSDRFISDLDAQASLKEAELKSICNFHYAEFSESLNEMTHLKVRASSLKDRILDIDERLQTSGEKLLQNSKELLQSHYVKQRIDQAIDEVTRATNLIGLANRAREQVLQRSYFSALKTIKLLKDVLDPVEEQVTDGDKPAILFALDRWIPKITETIKMQVRNALTEWFVLVRNIGQDLGETALSFVASKISDQISKDFSDQSGERAGKINTNTKRNMNAEWSNKSEEIDRVSDARRNLFRSRSDGNRKEKRVHRLRTTSSSEILKTDISSGRIPADDVVDVYILKNIDYTPVYQFVHIYECLELKEEAVEFYKRNRLPQASIQSMAPIDITNPKKGLFAKYYEQIFEKMIGFFLIEERLTTTTDLVAENELSRLWKQNIMKLVPVVLTELNTENHPNPSAIIKLVNYILLMASLFGDDVNLHVNGIGLEKLSTASVFSGNRRHQGRIATELLDPSPLLNVCRNSRLQIGRALSERSEQDANRLIEEESCQPFVVYTHSDPLYHRVVSLGLADLDMNSTSSQVATGQVLDVCSDSSDEDVESPKHIFKFKFSDTVPKLCNVLSQLIDESYVLALHLGNLIPENDKQDRKKTQERYAGAGTANERPVDSVLASIYEEEDGKMRSNETKNPKLRSINCAAIKANEYILHVNDKFEKVVNKDGISVEMLCQCYVNAWYFARACESFENNLRRLDTIRDVKADTSQIKKDPKYNSKLTSIKKLSETADSCQLRVIVVVHEKISELLSSISFVNWLPSESTSKTNDYMDDLIRYLDFTFGPTSSINLLSKPQNHAIHFTSFSKISEIILNYLTCDACTGINVLGLQKMSLDIDSLLSFAAKCGVPDLNECFTQLRQTVKLLVEADIDAYLDKRKRNIMYPAVETKHVINLLRKYKALGVSSRLFSSSKNPKIIKSKKITVAIKELQKEL